MAELHDKTRNLLLESIAKDCGLEEWTEPVEFPVGHPIVSPGDRLGHFYFPTSGILSTMIQVAEGATAEILNIGNEGMFGVPIWLGVSRSLESVLQQMPGQILRIPARIFCQRIVGRRRTERLLKRFTAYSLRFGSQTTICSSRHTVQQRVTRRLLDMADRAQSLTLQITHALLAQVLGVRRQSVTDVARKMQSLELISYKRGRIRILDRQRLEACSCECYRDMRGLYDRLVRGCL